VRRVGAEYHAAADGAVALDAVLAQLDPSHVEPGPPSTPAPDAAFGGVAPAGGRVGEVRVAGVTYAYAGSPAPVVRDLDLVAGPGLTVVTGPSGVGKSTLLDLLAGLRRPGVGTVEAPPSHYVTQRPFLSTGSVRQALTIGHPATDDQLWEALRAVGVDGVVAALPGGLSADLGDDGFGLSAGQRQRLALARAWLAPETLLLLDEPTAHLDPEGAEHVAALVAELAERRVVVAVTHRAELLTHADHHLVLASPAPGAVGTVDASPVEVIPGATSLPRSPVPAREEEDR
jgi:ATP-binding cassette, subfamily C, bacterial CydD